MESSPAAAGNREQARGRPAPQPDHAALLLYYWLLVAGALAAAFHELVLRQSDAFLSPGFGPGRMTLIWAFVAGVSLSLLFGKRLRARPVEVLVAALITSSFVIAASGPLFYYGFERPWLTRVSALTLPFGLGFASAVAVHGALRLFGAATSSLGALGRALDPFRLLALTAVAGFAAAGAAAIGNQRSGYILGMLLSVAALWTEPLYRALYLDRRRRGAVARALRVAAGAAFLTALGGFGLAEHQLPVARLAYFPGEVVFAAQSSREEIVVTSSQDAHLLFVDGLIRRTQLDGYRYVEAMVAPAMLASERPSRVLLLGTGDGLAEREVLRFPGVEEVLVVVPNLRMVELGRSSGWLRTASGGALNDPRVTVEEDELAAWASESEDTHDVIIAELPAPVTYEYGKLYTRYFFERLADLLGESGCLVVSATSAFSTPESYASVLATLRASGLNTLEYRVGVPLMGEMSFILAGRRELKLPREIALPRGSTAGQGSVGLGGANSFLNPGTLEQLFIPTPDTRALEAPTNLLYDQFIVDSYRTEIGADYLPPEPGDVEAESAAP